MTNGGHLLRPRLLDTHALVWPCLHTRLPGGHLLQYESVSRCGQSTVDLYQ